MTNGPWAGSARTVVGQRKHTNIKYTQNDDERQPNPYIQLRPHAGLTGATPPIAMATSGFIKGGVGVFTAGTLVCAGPAMPAFATELRTLLVGSTAGEHHVRSAANMCHGFLGAGERILRTRFIARTPLGGQPAVGEEVSQLFPKSLPQKDESDHQESIS